MKQTQPPLFIFNGEYDELGHLNLDTLNKPLFGVPCQEFLDFTSQYFTEGESIELNSLESTVANYVNNLSYKEAQGVMVVSTDNFYKLVNDEYLKFFHIRDNQVTAEYAYLKHRKNIENIELFYTLYPDHVHIFQQFEEIINKIANNVYQTYMQRYIYNKYGKFVYLVQYQYFIMKNIHALYLQNPTKYKISLKVVKDYIEDLPVKSLYHLINKYKEENGLAPLETTSAKIEEKKVFNVEEVASETIITQISTCIIEEPIDAELNSDTSEDEEKKNDLDNSPVKIDGEVKTDEDLMVVKSWISIEKADAETPSPT